MEYFFWRLGDLKNDTHFLKKKSPLAFFCQLSLYLLHSPGSDNHFEVLRWINNYRVLLLVYLGLMGLNLDWFKSYDTNEKHTKTQKLQKLQKKKKKNYAD